MSDPAGDDDTMPSFAEVAAEDPSISVEQEHETLERLNDGPEDGSGNLAHDALQRVEDEPDTGAAGPGIGPGTGQGIGATTPPM